MYSDVFFVFGGIKGEAKERKSSPGQRENFSPVIIEKFYLQLILLFCTLFSLK